MRGRPRTAPRTRGFSAAVITAVAIASVVTASPALAKCQPGRANDGKSYFAGWNRLPGANVGGVYANILNYSPWVQPGSEVSAWTMLTKSTDHANWAQVGWYEEAGGVRYTFTQYTVKPNWYTRFWAAKPVGQYTYYTTLWDAGTNRFSFQVAGSTIQTVNASFTPNEGQIFGETHTLASQMPGHSGGAEWFQDSHVYYTGAWRNFAGSAITTNSTEHRTVINNTLNAYIYDRDCTQ